MGENGEYCHFTKAVENIGDRTPDFFSGTGAGGINTSLYSGLGRQYRMGVRMEF